MEESTAVALVVPEELVETSGEIPNSFNYRDFLVKWSGWRTQNDSDKITGFWIAKDSFSERMFYFTTGGFGAECFVGYTFNLQVQEGHKFLTLFSLAEEADIEKGIALTNLKELIDKSVYTKH